MLSKSLKTQDMGNSALQSCREACGELPLEHSLVTPAPPFGVFWALPGASGLGAAQEVLFPLPKSKHEYRRG